MRNLIVVFVLLGVIGAGGCATLTNDAYMPISLSFSDGSNGNVNCRTSAFPKRPKSPPLSACAGATMACDTIATRMTEEM